MNDNLTAHRSTEYDNKIVTTIPFYHIFHKTTIELIQNADIIVDKWLDTGCGTGNLIIDASQVFSDTEFILSDPSSEMIAIAKEKINIANRKVTFLNSNSQDLKYDDNSFDVITAIQSHHYLDKETRMQATKNCFRMLKPNGLFITFENIMPLSNKGVTIGLNRWKNYQIKNGKTFDEARQHIERFGKDYFPISIIEHIDLLKESGFNSIEILWASFMQAGFYAIK